MRVAGVYGWQQASKRFGVKDSIDAFQTRKYGWRAELLRSIQRWTANRAQIVITPSDYFRRLVGGWVKNPSKVKTISNGIKLKNQDFNGSSAIGEIFTAGRLVPWKGFDFLIKLMDHPNLSHMRLWINGDGPDRDRLEKIIENGSSLDRILLNGAEDRNRHLKTMSESGIFILNTSFESFSCQVVEVMNAGIPIITTRIGSLPELIEDGKEGILVEPNNKEQILAAIKKISENHEFREMIVKNAKEKAKQFSIQRTVEQLVSQLKILDNH